MVYIDVENGPFIGELWWITYGKWWLSTSKRQSFTQSRGRRGPRFTELPNVFSEEPLKKMLVEELLGAERRDCDVGSISKNIFVNLKGTFSYKYII